MCITIYSFCYVKNLLWRPFHFLQRLKDIFHGLTLFLSKDLEDHAKLKRYIIAYPFKYLLVYFNKNWARKTYVALVDSVRNNTFLCFVSKIGFVMFWIRTRLEFSGFNPNRIGLAKWSSVSLGRYLKRGISAWNLASGMQNALPTPGTGCKSVFGFCRL